jgi:ribosomal protein S18 acetylase RimI-like enzyme
VVQVRRVGVDDVETVRALRLHALLDSPEAFGSTHEREAAFPESVWVARLGTSSNATLICEADGGSCGIVTVVRDESDLGLGHLVGMWVTPSARHTGAADLLVTAALRWAEQESLTTVRLCVVEGNDPAERLYRRHGFNPTGRSFVGPREGITEFEMERAAAA